MSVRKRLPQTLHHFVRHHHAQLAHELAPWFAKRLDPGTNAAIAAARQAAIAGIVDSFDVHVAAAERTLLGSPDAERLRAAAAALFVTA